MDTNTNAAAVNTTTVEASKLDTLINKTATVGKVAGTVTVGFGVAGGLGFGIGMLDGIKRGLAANGIKVKAESLGEWLPELAVAIIAS